VASELGVQAEEGGEGPVGAEIAEIQILPRDQLRVGIHQGLLEGQLILDPPFDPPALEHGQDQEDQGHEQQQETGDDGPEQLLRQFVEALGALSGCCRGAAVVGDG